MNFSELPLSDALLHRLNELGFHQPTPIQELALPHALQGRDVLGKAETGTGKTLAFSLPIAQKVDPSRSSIQALVLTPTRELARQVADTLTDLAPARGYGVVTFVGGEALAEQVVKLRKGCQVAVGTPGRILDLARQRILSLGWVEVAVLDEADRMLDMGFIDDVQKILAMIPQERQTLFFSATIPTELRPMIRKALKDPAEVETARGLTTASTIDQTYIRVTGRDKTRLLCHILTVSKGMSSIVFLNTKRDADKLGRELWSKGLEVATLHGDYPQATRDQVLDRFRRGEVLTLVATDVAQRGLDIENLSTVINYDVPKDPEDYVHRIGRTGRAGAKGVVMTLVDEERSRDFGRILARVGWKPRELALPAGLRTACEADSESRRPPSGPRRRHAHGRRPERVR